MTKVYCMKSSNPAPDVLGKAALAVLKRLVDEKKQVFLREVPIKVHFGEKGNTTFIPAKAYDPIIDYLESQGVKPSFIETNVLYRGARTTTTNHLSTAREHGFTRIPVIIADGEIGTDFDEVEINKQFFKTCKIGKGYGKYRQLLVTSHFKGHSAAGFGGALKQLAMGFASRSGKLAQHTDILPFIKAAKCTACGLCVEKCDFDALRLEGTAIIDAGKCAGCAGCIAACPQGAIGNSWKGTNFLEKIAEYAYGATRGKDLIYINFVHNVTSDCDCIGSPMNTVVGHVGVLAGTDPVALDAACLDLVQRAAGSKIFDAGRTTLAHAELIGLGSTAYTLVELG